MEKRRAVKDKIEFLPTPTPVKVCALNEAAGVGGGGRSRVMSAGRVK